MNKRDIDTRLPQIDVLRGLACFGVFIFHVAVVSGFPKRTLPPIELWGRTFSQIPSFFSFGATGVNLFFVVSGFCLALRPLRGATASIELQKYAKERFSRVYPAYFLAVLFSLIIWMGLDKEWSAPEVFSILLFLQGFIQEWHFGLNGALWSMSTEVQFYLIFPMLYFLFAKHGPVRSLSVALAVTVAYRWHCANLASAADVIGGINRATFLMNMLPGRIFEFSLGIFLAGQWVKNRDVLVKTCTIVALPMLFLGMFARMSLATWIADPVLGVMCAALVGAACGVKQITAANWLAKFGRISYSFFLIHFPVLSLVAAAGWIQQLSIYQRFLVSMGAGFAVSLLLSMLMYR